MKPLIKARGLKFEHGAEEQASPQMRETLDRIAEHVGTKIDWDINPGFSGSFLNGSDFAFDGKVIAGKRKVTDVIHDLAHFLCSSKKRRKVVNFGLGPSPDEWSNKEDSPELLTGKNMQLEEEQASLLGIMIEAHLGIRFTLTFCEHNWEDAQAVKKTKAALLRKGLVEDGVARVCRELKLEPINHFSETEESVRDYWAIG